jgi:stearoyl-CoA desaturase (Delta-9 desaturase)
VKVPRLPTRFIRSRVLIPYRGARVGHGTPDDWLERHVYGRVYGTWSGIFLLELAYIVLFGAIGITMWAIHMTWIPFFGAGVINGVTHYWGYRNYACPDASTNLIPGGS